MFTIKLIQEREPTDNSCTWYLVFRKWAYCSPRRWYKRTETCRKKLFNVCTNYKLCIWLV